MRTRRRQEREFLNEILRVLLRALRAFAFALNSMPADAIGGFL
jgi:hypothetical protein